MRVGARAAGRRRIRSRRDRASDPANGAPPHGHRQPPDADPRRRPLLPRPARDRPGPQASFEQAVEILGNPGAGGDVAFSPDRQIVSRARSPATCSARPLACSTASPHRPDRRVVRSAARRPRPRRRVRGRSAPHRRAGRGPAPSRRGGAGRRLARPAPVVAAERRQPDRRRSTPARLGAGALDGPRPGHEHARRPGGRLRAGDRVRLARRSAGCGRQQPARRGEHGGRGAAAREHGVGAARTCPGLDDARRPGLCRVSGISLYRERDPRADFVFDAMRRLPRYRVAATAAGRLSAIVRSRLPRPANLDLALAVVASAPGCPTTPAR